MASSLKDELSQKTAVFGLKVWQLIGIFVGISIVVILLLLTFYLTLRRKSRRGTDNLPVSQIPTVSKEIKEVRVEQVSTNDFSPRDGILLTIHDKTSDKESDKVLVHLGMGKKNGDNSSQSGSFHHVDKDCCGSQSGEEGSSGKNALYKAYNSHPITAPSPLTGLPEFSHLGWGHWFTLRDLELATGRFSKENILGEGGYGIVYRGNLINGTPVAIKKLLNNLGQAEKEFQVEVEAIGHVRHKNLPTINFTGVFNFRSEKMSSSSNPKGRTTIEVGADGVAVITIINPPVNSLALDVLYSLKENYDQALRRDDVKAIVVTGAKGKFSGGFDISAFGKLQGGTVESPKPGFISVEILTDTVEAARKPSVAAIDGLALGGGLEVAMACHARISTPNAQLGLPELQLGVLPGFGGTQRLPRLVGLAKSLEMMLTSKPVKGEEAVNLGLVDAVVPSNQLVDTARKWALDILERRKPWVASLYKTDKIEPLGEAREILKFARVQTRRQAPNLHHPLVVIDVVEEGIVSGPRAGLWKEAEAFQDLLHSDTCKALVNVFFAQRATTKVPGVTDLGLKPRRIKKVAILGGGLMGSGIATALLLSNYPVILKEVNEKFLQAGLGRVKANLQSSVKKGKMSREKFEKTLSLLKGVLDYEDFRDVDMVIEAVIENVSLKQQIFADLEKYCPPHCILGSNTSTIDLNLIGEKTKSQDRIIGVHFFSPAHVMPLLEIVRTQKTSPQVIVDLLDVGKKIKKTPVVVGNCTGFAVNRMFFPYTQAALLLVEHGVDVFRIDRVITKFGMPMGPFRLCDLVGFGVAIATGGQFVMNFPERTYKSMLIPLMQEDKRAGETTRRGFYVYDDRRKATPDPEIKKYIEKAREMSGVTIDPKMAKLSDKDIIEMIFFPVVNEACRVLAEGIAVKASDLDISAIMGMGFPPYRGGIMFWADTLGSKYICSRLDEWSRMYGDFFKPCSYLAERASKGVPLSSAADPAKSRL